MNRPGSTLFSAGLCGEGTEDHANELLKIDSRGVRAVAEARALGAHHATKVSAVNLDLAFKGFVLGFSRQASRSL